MGQSTWKASSLLGPDLVDCRKQPRWGGASAEPPWAGAELPGFRRAQRREPEHPDHGFQALFRTLPAGKVFLKINSWPCQLSGYLLRIVPMKHMKFVLLILIRIVKVLVLKSTSQWIINPHFFAHCSCCIKCPPGDSR